MEIIKGQKAFQGNCLIVSILFCFLTAGIYAWVVFPQTGMIDTYSDTSLHVLYARQFFSGEAPVKCYMYPITFACISILGRFIGNYYIGATVFVGICAFIVCFLQIYVVQKMIS